MPEPGSNPTGLAPEMSQTRGTTITRPPRARPSATHTFLESH